MSNPNIPNEQTEATCVVHNALRGYLAVLRPPLTDNDRRMQFIVDSGLRVASSEYTDDVEKMFIARAQLTSKAVPPSHPDVILRERMRRALPDYAVTLMMNEIHDPESRYYI